MVLSVFSSDVQRMSQPITAILFELIHCSAEVSRKMCNTRLVYLCIKLQGLCFGLLGHSIEDFVINQKL